MRTNDLTHSLIPGGAHTFSKGDDQFPANAPRYIERGDGAQVWDRDGNAYLDWTMGLRTMTLGYRYAPVIEAAIEQMWKGANFGRPSFIETELAGDLAELVPCAEMVKFAKNGSTITTAAIKLARAATGRKYVCFCQDHPFFSYDDWFIGTTPADGGIPPEASALSLPFRYNDSASLARHFSQHPGEIAAVILEPATTEPPRDGFLQAVRELCDRHGAVLIFDEMITGFRWHNGGAQAYYGVTPDLATFGKGIGNGFSVAALVGRRDIMELGGLHHDKKRVFLISTTHGAENPPLAAARAVIRTFRGNDVVGHLWRTGRALSEGLNGVAKEAGLGEHFESYGFACNPYYVCRDAKREPSLAYRTLFLQEMVRRGILMTYYCPSFAHTDDDVAKTLDAAREAFAVYLRALEDGIDSYLEGPPVKPVFRAYN